MIAEIVNSFNCLPESLTSNDDRVKAALVKSALNRKDEIGRILLLKKIKIVLFDELHCKIPDNLADFDKVFYSFLQDANEKLIVKDSHKYLNHNDEKMIGGKVQETLAPNGEKAGKMAFQHLLKKFDCPDISFKRFEGNMRNFASGRRGFKLFERHFYKKIGVTRTIVFGYDWEEWQIYFELNKQLLMALEGLVVFLFLGACFPRLRSMNAGYWMLLALVLGWLYDWLYGFVNDLVQHS